MEIDAIDPQAILFTFPKPTAAYGYGKPQVKIEFGARGDPWPTSRKVIASYIEETHSGTAPTASTEVTASDPERTFWEKVTLLHALHHGTRAKPDKNVHRLSRHVYDVHRIWNAPKLRTSLLNAKLLQAVVANKQVFFKETKARYELVTSFEPSCAPHEELATAMRADFAATVMVLFAKSTAFHVRARSSPWRAPVLRPVRIIVRVHGGPSAGARPGGVDPGSRCT